MSSYFCEFQCFPCELLKSRPRLTETIVSHGQKVLFHTEITENTERRYPFNLFNLARRTMFLNKDIKDVKDIRDIRAIGIRQAKGSCSKKHIPSGWLRGFSGFVWTRMTRISRIFYILSIQHKVRCFFLCNNRNYGNGVRVITVTA